METKPEIYMLKDRRQFLSVAEAGFKKPMPGLVLQVRRAGADDASGIGLGLTASKRCGGAVERNRIKRRLRRVAAEVLPEFGREGCTYVIIGRAAALKRPYGLLADDLKKALDALHKRLEERS